MRRPALLAAIVALVIFVFWPRHKAEAPAPPSKRANPDERVDVPRWVVQAPPGVAKLATVKKPKAEHYGLWMLADPNLPMIVADSLIVSRFPRNSLPLTKYQVDQLQPNRRFDTRAAVTHLDRSVEPNMQVLLTGDKFRLVGDESLLMTIQLFKDDQPVPIDITSAVARAIATDGSATSMETPVSFNKRDGDVAQMATLKLTGTPLEKHTGRVFVVVTYDANGKPAQQTLDLVYQPATAPPAVFNGHFREAMENGSLAIYVGVDVTEGGPYMIAANLFDANGTPAVSMLARMVQLEPGTREVRLEAFGRVIREAEAPSPFTMMNLRGYLFYPGGEPDRKTMPDWTEDYRTQKYALGDFSDDEYWDQHKQTQIDNLLAAAKSAPPGSQPSITISTATSQGWKPPW